MAVAVTLFYRRPLDRPDAFESVAQRNLGCLQGVGGSLGEAFQCRSEDSDFVCDAGNSFGAWRIIDSETGDIQLSDQAVLDLHDFALKDEEAPKSICFGIMYWLLAVETGIGSSWFHQQLPPQLAPKDHGRGIGNRGARQTCLALVRTFDDHSIAVRTMLAVGTRWSELRELCRVRFLAVLGDMADCFWTDSELIMLALQKEAHPGVGDAALVLLVRALVDFTLRRTGWLAGSVGHHACALTFLWAVRWIAALHERHRPPSYQVEVVSADLRRDFKRLAQTLFESGRARIVQDLGQSLPWGFLHCRCEPDFFEVWRIVSEELDVNSVPLSCLEHLISTGERRSLGFIVNEAATERNDCLHFQWFAQRHLGMGSDKGGPPASDAHLADIILCALRLAETSAAPPQHGLWSRLWAVAAHGARTPGGGDACLAFLLAAVQPGYGRRALASALLDAKARGELDVQIQVDDLAKVMQAQTAAELMRTVLQEAE
eukprot:TRINITY_DN48560_c0_g1_i1.p1 TRINITY_DN48560_c0_g1~~TRINITY_DN48560_c0_g1_i1.p1  ORF type:complete len:488 (-),score=76.91 TRINITY_DN48560_c0_g1_i1:60-1523(-)